MPHKTTRIGSAQGEGGTPMAAKRCLNILVKIARGKNLKDPTGTGRPYNGVVVQQMVREELNRSNIGWGMRTARNIERGGP